MKRLYRKEEKDEISYEMERLEREIKYLDSQDELSEWEYVTLEMKKKKLNYLRRM